MPPLIKPAPHIDKIVHVHLRVPESLAALAERYATHLGGDTNIGYVFVEAAKAAIASDRSFDPEHVSDKPTTASPTANPTIHVSPTPIAARRRPHDVAAATDVA